MEACPQMKFILVVQRKEGHLLSYVPQRPKVWEKKFTFDIPKFKFQKELKKKTSSFWAFLREKKQGCGSLTPNKCARFFLQILNPVNNADIGRWSKWNAGVTIFVRPRAELSRGRSLTNGAIPSTFKPALKVGTSYESIFLHLQCQEWEVGHSLEL